MVIQHNISAVNAYRQLGGNNSALSKNLEKLSSGYKVNRAADDAAGLAISEKMRAQIRGLETAQRNARDGISVIQTAEGALAEVHNMLNRMVELTTQAANGIYGSLERGNVSAEVRELNNEIDRIDNSTNFNERYLLQGQHTYVGGINGDDIMVGENIRLQVGDTANQAVTLEVFDLSARAYWSGVKGIPAAIVGGASSAAAQISNIKTFINEVSTYRAYLGAMQNRLEHTINNLGIATENITAAESRIRDTDMAEEITQYTKNNILVQSAQSMLAQANMIPQGVLQLLG